MSILRWDKPKKVMTTQQWSEHYGFEDGPTGGYSPNMSEADQLSWKAKITGKKLGFPQVEIRKTTNHGSQIVIIVNLGGGYNYKYYRAVNDKCEYPDTYEEYVKFAPAYLMKRWPTLYPTLAEAEEDIVSEDEYNLEKYPTKGINVHIATNGPIQMTFEEMSDMQNAIEEAKTALSALIDSSLVVSG